MSSRGLKWLSVGVFGVGEEVAVDDVGESSFEGAHGFHAGVAELHPTLEELLGRRVTSPLRDRDAMDRTVQLAVARA
jgi:hypothetical protein